MAIRIRSIEIRNYKGIAERDVDVGPAGAIIIGKNGSGKTSVLDAVRAALAGRNVGPDAVKLGADRAEILIDMGDAIVKRSITGRGTTVTAESPDGASAIKAPATFLAKLLGAGQLDPIELVTEKDAAKRRSAVLAALPLEPLTTERLRDLVPGLEFTSADLVGHPLEAVARIGARYEERRKAANAEGKTAAAKITALQAQLDAMPAGAPAPNAAAMLEAANQARLALDMRSREAEAAEKRSSATRAKIARLRATADAKRAGAPADIDDEALEALAVASVAAADEVLRLESELAKARAALDVAHAAHRKAQDQADARAAALAAAADLDVQAAQLEQALEQTSVERPSAEQVESADAAIASFKLARDAHEAHARRQFAAATLASDKAALEQVRAQAKELDRIVKALRADVPAALIAESTTIAGLGVSGNDITLDGVSLDQVNDAARLRLAVEIAKRATPKAKVLITDRLELLDPEAMDEFVSLATSDGWQLIGARVDRGALRIEALEHEVQVSEEAAQ